MLPSTEKKVTVHGIAHGFQVKGRIKDSNFFITARMEKFEFLTKNGLGSAEGCLLIGGAREFVAYSSVYFPEAMLR